jgi:hypothetical protein
MENYFYENMDKLIGDKLLLTEQEQIVKVEELFNIEINLHINEENIKNDSTLLLYILCIHKMSTFKHENIVRHKLIQFFNYHKGQTGGNHFVLLSIIKKYISDKVSKIQPKPKYLE